MNVLIRVFNRRLALSPSLVPGCLSILDRVPAICDQLSLLSRILQPDNGLSRMIDSCLEVASLSSPLCCNTHLVLNHIVFGFAMAGLISQALGDWLLICTERICDYQCGSPNSTLIA